MTFINRSDWFIVCVCNSLRTFQVERGNQRLANNCRFNVRHRLLLRVPAFYDVPPKNVVKLLCYSLCTCSMTCTRRPHCVFVFCQKHTAALMPVPIALKQTRCMPAPSEIFNDEMSSLEQGATSWELLMSSNATRDITVKHLFDSNSFVLPLQEKTGGLRKLPRL